MDLTCIDEKCNPGLECIMEGPGNGICSKVKAEANAKSPPKSQPKQKGKA